jgi:1,4-alpha-glucan branching enzyme
VWSDRLRVAIRGVIAQAAGGREATVDLDLVRDALGWPPGFQARWRGIQHLENHDIVYANHSDRQPRIAALGDATNARSWYARSRARVALGLLLTAPGIPMLFMGQEFLEDKQWSDNVEAHADLLLHWAGLDHGDKQTTCVYPGPVWLRRRHPAPRQGHRRVPYPQPEPHFASSGGWTASVATSWWSPA